MLYVLPPPTAPRVLWQSVLCATTDPGSRTVTQSVINCSTIVKTDSVLRQVTSSVNNSDSWMTVAGTLRPSDSKRPPRSKSLRIRKESGSGVTSEDDDGLRSKSLSECYFAGKGAAVVLPPNERVNSSRRVSNSGSDIQQHLQSMFYLLRPEDTLKMAVKLESVHPGRTRYLVVVCCLGRQDVEECCLLGIDCNEKTTVGLVLRVLADTTITLDGDGGFSVSVAGRHHIFKPVSVQAMWSALQTLHKVSGKARELNYFLGGFTHDWVAYYEGRVDSDRSCLNEWHAMDNLESRRPPSPDSVRNKPSQRDETESVIRCTLKEIMMSVDLDEVTSKHIRGRLEEDLDMDLGEFKSFIDQEMLTILGQMDAATEIFDHVYLGSEWNASNHEELLKNGVRHILNVTREIDNFFPGVFNYLNVRVYDDEKTDLLKHWDDTFKYISRARAEGSKVLVHCKMGVSRSASVVIAYAMKAYGWEFKTAFEYVKRKRSCIKPNGSFISQLETYQGILDAMKNREKLQRSKSETNLKNPATAANCTNNTGSGDKCSSPPPGDILLTPGATLARVGARPKSWSPDNAATAEIFHAPEPQAPLSMSLEQLERSDACTCRCTRRTSHIRFPCGDGQQFSVSPNRVMHLPSVRRRVSELERKTQPDRRGLALPLAAEEGWDPGERPRPSRQSSWSSYDSAVVLEAPSSRQSSWGALPSRNSSWGSYDMRPTSQGTVRRTKQRIEENQEPPLLHYASSPTLSSLEPAVPGLVQNLKREFEAKSVVPERADARSLPSSPVSARESPPLEDLSVRHLVGQYEAQPPPPKVEKVLFVIAKSPPPSTVMATVAAKAAVKKQQGRTHPLAHLPVNARHQNAVYNTM